MELLKQTLENKSTIRIGKNLLNEGTIKQIKDLVKKRDMVKIKVLKAAINEKGDLERIIAEILKATDFKILDVRGNAFIISSKPVKGHKITKRCKEIVELSKNI